MAGSSNRRRASDEAEGSRAGAAGGGDHQLPLQLPLDFFLLLTILFVFSGLSSGIRLATNPALSDDSSESYNYSPSRYSERDALRFKAELDETRRELEDVSNKAGIAELEWEHQRKQLLETIDGKSLDLL
jgi:hypothetical protein